MTAILTNKPENQITYTGKPVHVSACKKPNDKMLDLTATGNKVYTSLLLALCLGHS